LTSGLLARYFTLVSAGSAHYISLVTVAFNLLLTITDPIRIELIESKAPPGWVESLSHFAWPLAVVIILLVYREVIGGFVAVVSQRASEISIGSWASFKLPTLTETPLDQDVTDFKQVEGSMLTESYKTELFKQFRSSRKDEYAVINVGEGQEWISSRLFVFSVMLQRMKCLKCIVFLYKTPSANSAYLGTANIDRVRWAFAARQPWLEAAFAKAYAEAAPNPQQVAPFTWIANNNGALQPEQAENIVRRYVQLLLLTSAAIPPSPATDWVKIGNTFEHSKWVTADEVEQALGIYLWRDSVHQQESKKDLLRNVLKCSSPYVAILSDSGDFQALVNRAELLDKIGHRLNVGA
jgi:hypothetical protein